MTKAYRYRYTECGLDNVFIEGIEPRVDDHGEDVQCILNVNGLHKTIAYGIVESDRGMSGQELRFLRTEMGFTQAELAKHVHCDAQTIARWEKSQTPIQAAAEVIIRVLVREKLGLDAYGSIEDVAAKCIPKATVERSIVIDGRNPKKYQLAA